MKQKILALLLVLVMTPSFCFSVLAAKSFTDQSDIADGYVEAVNMLVELNVISGYPDGTFRPQWNITRAEFAKMIYVLKYNADEGASLFAGNTSEFVDVEGNVNIKWAKGYINYCASQNIVSGMGNKQFNPHGKVKVSEATKMLLVVMGYDPVSEGFTGNGWDLNVVSKAIDIGLYKGCTLRDPNDYATRELIAKLIHNAIFLEQTPDVEREEEIKTEYEFYSMYPGVPDFGKVFGVTPYSSINKAWAYKLSDVLSYNAEIDWKTEYLKALVLCGFTPKGYFLDSGGNKVYISENQELNCAVAFSNGQINSVDCVQVAIMDMTKSSSNSSDTEKETDENSKNNVQDSITMPTGSFDNDYANFVSAKYPLHLYSNDKKTYLGKLSTNKYDSDSISNPYGTYGSKYSDVSIFNEYGDYGSKYSSDSAYNKYTSTPPIIVDSNGKFVAYLTANEYKTDGVDYIELMFLLKKYNQ